MDVIAEPLGACRQLSSRLDSLGNPLFNAIHFLGQNERPHFCFHQSGVSDVETLNPVREEVDEALFDLLMHEYSLYGHADLTRMVVAPFDQRLDNGFDI